MGFFSDLKNTAVSTLADKFLSNYLSRYGEMLDFSIDTENKKIRIKVLLKGETDPLLVTIHNYEVLRENGRHFIKINDFTTSREWMNIVAEDFLKEKRFELPEKYAGVIKMLL